MAAVKIILSGMAGAIVGTVFTTTVLFVFELLIRPWEMVGLFAVVVGTLVGFSIGGLIGSLLAIPAPGKRPHDRPHGR